MAPKAAPKAPPAHPKYEVMVADAIASLKDRTGSSTPAIAKFIEGKYKGLPDNWKKLLAVQLKRLAESGKLVKVRPVRKSRDISVAFDRVEFDGKDAPLSGEFHLFSCVVPAMTGDVTVTCFRGIVPAMHGGTFV